MIAEIYARLFVVGAGWSVCFYLAGRESRRSVVRLSGGKEYAMSKEFCLVLAFIGVTMAAATADWYWSFRPMGFVSILGDINNMDRSEIDFIHEHYPVSLVQPEWVSDQPFDIFMNWSLDEMRARFFLVLAGWITCVFFISRDYHRSRARSAGRN
jgi:hypothetical protein